MKEIGGYFELELARGDEYHSEAIKLNSGRSCLLYILRSQKPAKIYVPYYICNSILEPIISEGIEYEFYNIDLNFEIVIAPILKSEEKLLYVNYYGLKSNYVQSLVEKYAQALVIDNTQAFFDKQVKDIDTFYSPRKFFGVSDGGYLYTNSELDENLEQDKSIEFSYQLLGRLDKNAVSYYEFYLNAENRLINQPVKRMSKLTQAILKSVDYGMVRDKRNSNMEYLHSGLKEKGKFDFDLKQLTGAMIYPFFVSDTNIRELFISNKIYIAQYWPEVKTRKGSCNIEKTLLETLIPLPIDQRYDEKDMDKVLNILHRGCYA